MAITGIKSRFVVAVGGVILVLLGLFPILGAFVAIVPLPVLGGAGLALFGTVAASGIRTLTNVDFSGNANLVIVALSLSMGIIPIAVPEFYDQFPAWFVVIFDSGITAAAITAVLLNVVFNIVGRSGETEGPIFAEAPPVAAISEEDEERLLNEGRDAADQRPFHHDAGQARHEAPRAAHTGSVASEHGAPTTTPTTEHDPTTQTKESGS